MRLKSLLFEMPAPSPSDLATLTDPIGQSPTPKLCKLEHAGIKMYQCPGRELNKKQVGRSWLHCTQVWPGSSRNSIRAFCWLCI